MLGAGDQDLPSGVPVLFEIRCFLHYLLAAMTTSSASNVRTRLRA